jgi:hypothetical protein
LRDVNGFEGIGSREFELSLASKFPIGRASKNTTKKDLMPAANNAYIDSPVISREHAVLTVNADSGAPHVYITDKNSMHGTFLNGEKLEIEVPKLLASGDKLQFGVDVNRGEGSPPRPLSSNSANMYFPQSSSPPVSTSSTLNSSAQRQTSRRALQCLIATKRTLVVRHFARVVKATHLHSLIQTTSPTPPPPTMPKSL